MSQHFCLTKYPSTPFSIEINLTHSNRRFLAIFVSKRGPKVTNLPPNLMCATMLYNLPINHKCQCQIYECSYGSYAPLHWLITGVLMGDISVSLHHLIAIESNPSLYMIRDVINHTPKL